MELHATLSNLTPGKAIIFTGHGVGGAMAQQAVVSTHGIFPDNPLRYLLTYDSPGTLDVLDESPEFVTEAFSNPNLHSVRFLTSSSIISRAGTQPQFSQTFVRDTAHLDAFSATRMESFDRLNQFVGNSGDYYREVDASSIASYAPEFMAHMQLSGLLGVLENPTTPGHEGPDEETRRSIYRRLNADFLLRTLISGEEPLNSSIVPENIRADAERTGLLRMSERQLRDRATLYHQEFRQQLSERRIKWDLSDSQVAALRELWSGLVMAEELTDILSPNDNNLSEFRNDVYLQALEVVGIQHPQADVEYQSHLPNGNGRLPTTRTRVTEQRLHVAAKPISGRLTAAFKDNTTKGRLEWSVSSSNPDVATVEVSSSSKGIFWRVTPHSVGQSTITLTAFDRRAGSTSMEFDVDVHDEAPNGALNAVSSAVTVIKTRLRTLNKQRKDASDSLRKAKTRTAKADVTLGDVEMRYHDASTAYRQAENPKNRRQARRRLDELARDLEFALAALHDAHNHLNEVQLQIAEISNIAENLETQLADLRITLLHIRVQNSKITGVGKNERRVREASNSLRRLQTETQRLHDRHDMVDIQYRQVFDKSDILGLASEEVRINDAPIAVDDFVITRMNEPIVVRVRKNDVDSENDKLTVLSYTQPIVGGSVALTKKGHLKFTPDTGFRGTATFTYQIQDERGATATADVSVRVGSGGFGSVLLANHSSLDMFYASHGDSDTPQSLFEETERDDLFGYLL